MKKRKINKIIKKVNYLVGFSGHGTTALDKKPNCGKLTWREKKRFSKFIEELKELKRKAWRRACIETLCDSLRQENQNLKKEKNQLEGLLVHILPEDWGKVKTGCLIKIEEYDKLQCDCGIGLRYNIPAWQYHLQQLALEKDRLQYIKKFL